MVHAIALPLVTLLAGFPIPAAMPAGDVPARGSVIPADRGIDPDDRDDDRAHHDEVDACPTHLWTLPVEIKGLACVLLLPKEEPEDRGRS